MEEFRGHVLRLLREKRQSFTQAELWRSISITRRRATGASEALETALQELTTEGLVDRNQAQLETRRSYQKDRYSLHMAN